MKKNTSMFYLIATLLLGFIVMMWAITYPQTPNVRLILIIASVAVLIMVLLCIWGISYDSKSKNTKINAKKIVESIIKDINMLPKTDLPRKKQKIIVSQETYDALMSFTDSDENTYWDGAVNKPIINWIEREEKRVMVIMGHEIWAMEDAYEKPEEESK